MRRHQHAKISLFKVKGPDDDDTAELQTTLEKCSVFLQFLMKIKQFRGCRLHYRSSCASKKKTTSFRWTTFNTNISSTVSTADELMRNAPLKCFSAAAVSDLGIRTAPPDCRDLLVAVRFDLPGCEITSGLLQTYAAYVSIVIVSNSSELYTKFTIKRSPLHV